MAVASHGSYHRAGDDAAEDFDAVLATAGRLGARRIRIWAGATPPARAGLLELVAGDEAATVARGADDGRAPGRA